MNKYIIPNLQNACRILKELSSRPQGLSIQELTNNLSVPRTTTLRILHTLCQEHLLVQQEKKYIIGPALLHMGLQSLAFQDSRDVFLPVVRKLASDTGETAHVAALSDDKSLILEVCDSPNPVHVASRVGSLFPLYCCSTGKVFLAFLRGESIKEYTCTHTLTKRTPHTIKTLSGLTKEVRQILKNGYAVDNEEYYEGVRCLAAPLRNAYGDVVGAIGITASSLRFTKSRIPEVSKKVLAAAEKLSGRLWIQHF